MEIAGLVVGTVPLVGLLQTCLHAYQQISALRLRDKDMNYFALRVLFEENRLSGLEPLIIAVSSPCNHQRGLQTLVRETLQTMKDNLTEFHALALRHATLLPENTSRGEQNEQTSSDITISSNRLNRLPRRLKAAMNWVAGDGDRIEVLIRRLKNLNEQLESLIIPPEQLAAAHLRFVAHTIATCDSSRLREIQLAACGPHADVAKAAKIKASCILHNDDVSGQKGDHFTQILDRAQISNLAQFEWIVPGRHQSMGGKALKEVIGQEHAWAKMTHLDGNSLVVLVEWREGIRSSPSIASHQARLDRLVHTLNQMTEEEHSSVDSGQLEDQDSDSSEIEFGLLPCLGWVTANAQHSRIGLVFKCPSDDQEAFISLNERIRKDREKKLHAPALGDRFVMAVGLVKRLASLMMVGWVHRGIRSHNVLMINHSSFFVSGEDQAQALKQRLFLTGFTYARPNHQHQDHGLTMAPDLSVLPSADDSTYMLYRPTNSFYQQHAPSQSKISCNFASHVQESLISPCLAAADIFGLGIILLEIGLWRTIRSMFEEWGRHRQHGPETGRRAEEPATIDAFLQSNYLKCAVDTLAHRMGQIYRDTVQRCLKLQQAKSHCAEEGDFDGAELLQRIFTELSKCKA